MLLATNNLRTRLGLQLNTLLYAKTLVRKDAASSAASDTDNDQGSSHISFSSKSEVMTLMTTDVGRARDWSRLMMAPIGRLIPAYTCSTKCQLGFSRYNFWPGDWDIYAVQSSWWVSVARLFKGYDHLIDPITGMSVFVGLGIASILVPLNQLAGTYIVKYQKNVMKARDARVALTNEVSIEGLLHKLHSTIISSAQFLGAIRMIKVSNFLFHE